MASSRTEAATAPEPVPSRHRLGVALVLPEPVRTEIDGIRRAFGLSGAGRMPPHVTLAGPVNVRTEALDEVRGRIDALAREAAPMEIDLGPVTTFGVAAERAASAGGGDVVFLAVGGPDLEALMRLRQAVHRPPLVRDERPFVPHVTLSDRSRGRAASMMAATEGFRCRIVLDAITVFTEERTETGSRWAVLGEHRFGSGGVVGRGGLATTMAVRHLDGMIEVVASIDGRRVGRAVLWAPGERLLSLEVDPASRHLGVGARLIAWAEQAGRDAGCSKLRADPHSFLERFGFEPDQDPDQGGELPGEIVRRL